MVDAETGVAGRIQPGDFVDILATVEDPNTKARNAQVIIQNAIILDVGVVTAVEEETANGAFQEAEAVPVTFSLSTADSLKIAYAESFSVKLRLALRGTGDDSLITDDQTTYAVAGQEQPS